MAGVPKTESRLPTTDYGKPHRLTARAGFLFFFLAGAGEDAEDFFLAHDDQLLVINLDFRARVLAEQDAVALFDVEGAHLAVFVDLAFADSDDCRRLWRTAIPLEFDRKNRGACD